MACHVRCTVAVVCVLAVLAGVGGQPDEFSGEGSTASTTGSTTRRSTVTTVTTTATTTTTTTTTTRTWTTTQNYVQVCLDACPATNSDTMVCGSDGVSYAGRCNAACMNIVDVVDGPCAMSTLTTILPSTIAGMRSEGTQEYMCNVIVSVLTPLSVSAESTTPAPTAAATSPSTTRVTTTTRATTRVQTFYAIVLLDVRFASDNSVALERDVRSEFTSAPYSVAPGDILGFIFSAATSAAQTVCSIRLRTASAKTSIETHIAASGSITTGAHGEVQASAVTQEAADTTSSSSGTDGGVIAVAVIFAVVGAVLLVLLAVWIHRKRVGGDLPRFVPLATPAGQASTTPRPSTSAAGEGGDYVYQTFADDGKVQVVGRAAKGEKGAAAAHKLVLQSDGEARLQETNVDNASRKGRKVAKLQLARGASETNVDLGAKAGARLQLTGASPSETGERGQSVTLQGAQGSDASSDGRVTLEEFTEKPGYKAKRKSSFV